MPARKEPDTSTYAGRFAIRLRTLREKAKLTVEDVAEKTGIPWRTYYNWESGRSEPKFNQLPILSELFGLKNPRSIMPEK